MQVQTNNFLFDQNTELDKQDDFTASSSYSSNFEDVSPVELQEPSTANDTNPGATEFVSKIMISNKAQPPLSTKPFSFLNKSDSEPPSTLKEKLKDILHLKDHISIEGTMAVLPPRDSWKSSKWKLLFGGGERSDFFSNPLLSLSNKFQTLGPIFQSSFLGKDVTIMQGEEASALFFDVQHMERRLHFNELYYLLVKDGKQEYQLQEHVVYHLHHAVCSTMLDPHMWNGFAPVWEKIFTVHMDKWLKKRTFKWSDEMRLLLMDGLSKYLLGVERSEELAHFLVTNFSALEKHIQNATTANKYASIIKEKLFSIVQRHFYGLWVECLEVPHVMQRIAKQVKEVNGEVKYIIRDEIFQILFTAFEVTTHALCQSILYIHHYPFLWQQVVEQLQQQSLVQVDDSKLQHMIDYIMENVIYVPLLFGKSKHNLIVNGKAVLKDTLCGFCPMDLKNSNINYNLENTKYPLIGFPQEKVAFLELTKKVLQFVLTQLAKHPQLQWKLVEKQKLEINYTTPLFQITDGVLLYDFSK